MFRIGAVDLAGPDMVVIKREYRTSWKPEVPFMAGSFGDPVQETAHTAQTHCYVQATGSSY